MAKGAMKKARRRAAGMEVEGGKAAAPAAAPGAAGARSSKYTSHE